MDDAVKSRIKTMSKLLPENIMRVYLALEAQALGYGGLTKISQLTGVSITTLRVGTKELNNGTVETLVKTHSESKTLIHLRERGPGGGRLSISKKYKDIKEALEKLVADSTFGSPEQPLLWTTKSLRNLESELQSVGYQISY